eukprot:CAMPEP_0119260578 /NCGR_PEP_ID=MMETSP1329-20130426/891_1 /TAXON_ID=114041 /ORGANISM="Genus nov. species nov., Strain RCC1024" /LENGTH=159 /DNA_ID=CAMNT_0007260003 /DNA_START=120 /DNA_END=599 /DNA_ORIENTATION=-
MQKSLVILALATSASAFAPQQQQRASTSLSAYVPQGLDPKQWKDMQEKAKQAKVDNKKKYVKGAPQVLGVGPYLERLAERQTFYTDKNGNPRVEKTGHEWAKVKFGNFDKESFDAWKAAGATNAAKKGINKADFVSLGKGKPAAGLGNVQEKKKLFGLF